MEVPEIISNLLVVLPTETGQAAKILTPGPIMSGFKIPGLAILGPLEENSAT